MRYLSLALVLASVSAPAPAQSCSKLEVKVDSKTVTLALTGADKNARGFIFMSMKKGNFSIKAGPVFSLTLGVRPPWIPIVIETDGTGAAGAKFDVPSRIPEIQLYGQGASMQVKFPPPRITFCTSNVAPFKIGG